MATLHAARGEVYAQRSGPVGPAGAGVVVHTARANKVSGLPVCARRCTRLAIAQPMHIDLSIDLSIDLIMPSFLIDQYTDEVSYKVS